MHRKGLKNSNVDIKFYSIWKADEIHKEEIHDIDRWEILNLSGTQIGPQILELIGRASIDLVSFITMAPYVERWSHKK